ncbi:MAG: response regulator, partial [Proteobacteria bacterium]|nr:response regulator [Pseudomonadota bacterium]
EASEALERLTASSRSLLAAVEGSALPALDRAIAAADAMAGDPRMTAAARRRLGELKTTVEAARAELLVTSGAPAARSPAAAKPRPDTEPKAKAARAAAKAKRPEPALKSVGPLRVLVGEANGVHQLQLRTLLAQIGVRPEVVSDAAQLMAAWRREAWNLILLDVQAPEFGLEAAREIRAAELKAGWACTPIVALGGRPAQAQASREASAVVDSYVAKPIAGPHLVSAIEAALAAEPPTCIAQIAVAQVA